MFRRPFTTALGLMALALGAAPALANQATQPSPEPQPTRHELQSPAGAKVAYLVIEPSHPTPAKERWMVVFLHGAGGNISGTGYNLARPPYAKIRHNLAQRGAYVVVPALGRLHFMNDQAKESLTKVIDQVASDHSIDPKRVHLMGTSMGAGSVLAYAVNRPDRVRSVCAIMPMTDFTAFVKETPKYAQPIKESYGGSVEETPQPYDANSPVKNPDALAKIPVLLIHGMADKSVLVSHSEKLAAILKAKGYPCTFIGVKDGGHKDEIVTELQEQIVEFLIEANE